MEGSSRSLSKPERSISTGTEYMGARNETEAKLIQMWAEILNQAEVGVRDNFFELGGHSLQATILLSRMNKELNVVISLQDLFANPTIEAMAAYVLHADKTEFDAIERVDGGNGYYPVSPQQKRLYFIQEMDVNTTSYNLPAALTIEGDLDLKRVQEVSQALVRRHESLRTSFEMIDGELMQRVHEKVELPIQYVNTNQSDVDEIIQAFIQPFVLAKAPLIRAGIVNLSENKCVLLFDMHHIISDETSMNILMQDFFKLYAGIDLPDLRIQYKDYAVWMREKAQNSGMQKQEQYWFDIFSREIPVLELPTDFSRAAVQSFEGDHITFKLNEVISDKLVYLSRDLGTTMYMTLLSAYYVLLFKYSGQEDIVVGSPIAGRQHADLTSVIGMFVNPLALRNQPSANKTFRKFLHEVKQNSILAFENQECQLEEFVDKFEVRRNLGRYPLFDTMFIPQNLAFSETTVEGLNIEPYPLTHQLAKFDLTLSSWESDCKICCDLEYSTNLFHRDTAQRISEHFVRILEQVVDNPDLLLGDLDILTEPEREQLLVTFNDTTVHRPEYAKTVCQLFEEQAQKTPDAVAIVCGSGELTYHQLNQRANQLARVLRREGLAPNKVVGILLGRSSELIVGILAALKAGAAYLPIDPEYPRERIEYMLQDSEASFLMADENYSTDLKFTGKLVSIHQSGLFKGDDGNLNLEIHLADLAYMIYTSGSTGKPKGVMIEHHSLSDYVQSFIGYFSICNKDVLLHHSSISFDTSVEEIYPALLTGAKIVIVGKATVLDANQLVESIVSKSVTVISCSPLVLSVLDETLTDHSVRVFISGGDVLERRYFSNLTNCTVYNTYGPSESTVCVTYFNCTDDEEQRVLLGKPIANRKVYILDQNQKLLPIGVPGELCVAGSGVARGYWKQPELTAEKFIRNPYNPSDRLYRTGDLACLLADGNIKYLGRIDHQVKIRGYRIELTEIENVLSQIKAIQEAAVVARLETNGNKRLVGFIVRKPGISLPSSRELREHCGRFLPEFMVPAAFVELEKLPLTPNGKVDRKYLMNDAFIPTEQDTRKVLPRSDTEKRLAEIWGELLGKKQIGVYDNFFEIGGQSILATKMMIRIQKEFQITISFSVIFDNPTIKSLTAHILSQKGKEQKTQEGSIATSTEKSNLSYAQKRMWFLNELIQETTLYNVPFAIHITGNLQKDILENCLYDIVSRHEVLRTTFGSSDGYPIAIVGESNLSFTYYDLRELRDGEKKHRVQALLHQLVHTRFVLSRDSLFHANLIQLSTNQYVLGFVFHHIICDAWSLDIFMKELSILYENKIGNSSVILDRLSIQYGDYANWEQAKIAEDSLNGHIDYWKEQLKGHDPVLMLPTDYLRPKSPSHSGAIVRFVLSKDLTAGIKSIGQLHGCSLYMTLLAAFQTFCFRYSGQSDFLIGTPVSNRNHMEVEKLIGFFVNTLVMRANLTGEPTFVQVLNRVRKVALEAYEHQGVSFDKLVEVIQPDRDLGYNPLFQVMFQLVPQIDIHISDFKVEEAHLETTTSKFDLSLHIVEKGDGLQCEFIYRADLFKAERIQQFIRHFEQLLKSIVNHPDACVSQLPMISDSEHQSLIISCDAKPYEPLYDSNVFKLFEEQVERTPDFPAVQYEDKSLTYYELNARANQIAHYLQGQGIREESFVGLCMQRSHEMLVVLLGIGKSGGAYVALDPEIPLERIKYQINDSKASIVLTDQLHIYRAFRDTGRIIYLNDDEVKPNIDNQPKTNPMNTLQMNNAVYLIYTSGSTGEPKGVVVEHRNLVNYLNGTKDTVCLGEGTGYATVSTLAADLGNTMIFHSLISGGVLHVIGKQRISDPDTLAEYFEQNEIDCLKIVPSHLRALLSGEYPENVIPKRRIIFGGEPLHWELVDQVLSLNPNCQVINHYGPTETTIGVATNRLHHDTPRLSPTVPLGFPIWGTELYVLDDSLRFVPQGVKGELCVGGPSVSRGYIGKDEATAKQYIEYSDYQIQAKRLYRTGDLVRQLSDGSIEYLGRRDGQVKIRGYRIEMTEISAVYQNHPDIRFALAIMQGDTGKQEELTCYVAFRKNKTLPVEHLRQYGMEHLPSYMIPASFYMLDEIPLTMNGKVDRRALSGKRIEIIEERQLKQLLSPDEEQLLSIWSELLDISSTTIGVQDNFFTLGGHSLLATHLISRIRREWQAPVPLSLIFEYPTISGLASQISRFTTGLNKPSFQKINIGNNEPQRLSYAQKRLWFIDQLESNSALYNVPKVILIHGPLNIDLFVKTLIEVMDRHHILRTIYQEMNGVPWQITLTNCEIPFIVMDWRDQPDLNAYLVKKYLTKAAKEIFDLRKGPLVKAHLIRTGDEDYWFMLNFHHIVTDAWSIRIILMEVETIYRLHLEEPDGVTLSVPTQYSQFSNWERCWINSDYIEEQYAYWKQQLTGCNPYVSLPPCTNRPERLSTKGTTEYVSIPKSAHQDVISFSRDKGVSLFMTTLSAFGILIYMLTDQEDFCIGTPIANRTDKEIEDIVGFFVNTLVIRMDLTSNPTFEELLSKVKQTTLEAYANQEVPFDNLVEGLLTERNPSYSPFFQIFFETSQDVPLQLPHVNAISESIDLGLSKFDLSVNLIEKSDVIEMELEYNTDLYDREVILQFANKYVELLQKVIERPDYRLKEFCQLQAAVALEDAAELWI